MLCGAVRAVRRAVTRRETDRCVLRKGWAGRESEESGEEEKKKKNDDDDDDDDEEGRGCLLWICISLFTCI